MAQTSLTSRSSIETTEALWKPVVSHETRFWHPLKLEAPWLCSPHFARVNDNNENVQWHSGFISRLSSGRSKHFACSRLINPHVAVKRWMQVMFVIIFSLVQSLWLEAGPVSSAALCGETWKREAFCTLLPAPSLSASVSTTVQEYIVSPCSDIRWMTDCINLIS